MALMLTPSATETQPDRLQDFFRGTNYASVKRDIKWHLRPDYSSFEVDDEQADAWVEIFVAFWKAVGEMLKAEAASLSTAKVWNHGH